MRHVRRIKVPEGLLDRERTLRMDFNAMVAYEEATGESLLQKNPLSDLSVRRLRALLWAMLLHEDPALTESQVGAMIGNGNVDAISKVVIEAMGTAQPDSDPEGDTVPAGGDEKNGGLPTG